MLWWHHFKKLKSLLLRFISKDHLSLLSTSVSSPGDTLSRDYLTRLDLPENGVSECRRFHKEHTPLDYQNYPWILKGHVKFLKINLHDIFWLWFFLYVSYLNGAKTMCVRIQFGNSNFRHSEYTQCMLNFILHLISKHLISFR